MRPVARESKVFWGAVAAAGLLAIGSFGPWARAFIITISGIEMHGWIALLGALLAGAMLYLYATRPTARALLGAAFGGLLGLAIVALRANQIFGYQGAGEDSLFGDTDLITPGWGLFMSGIGAAALIATTLLLYRNEHVGRANHEEPDAQQRLL